MNNFLNKLFCVVWISVLFGELSLISTSTDMDILLVHRNDPRIKAFLDIIAYAEGTFKLKDVGYRLRYPNTLFTSFADHPRTISCAPFKGSQLCATAAGRYQILGKTWDRIVPRIGARDFSPLQQDRAAILLIQEKRAIPDIFAGNITKAIVKVNSVWATFPDSPHQQTTCTMDELLRVYWQQLAKYRKGLL